MLPTFPAFTTSSQEAEITNHVVRHDDRTFHCALSQAATARTGSSPTPAGVATPKVARDTHGSLPQIADGTPFGIHAEWSKA